MARIKQSPKLPAEKRREQLLGAAQKLFLAKGYRETTTEEIAREVGLTKGALYFHFKNKEDILYELVKAISDKYHGVFDRVTPKGTSPGTILKLMAQHRQVWAAGHFRNAAEFWGYAMSVPRINVYMRKRGVKAIERFAEVVDPKYGKSKEDLRTLAVLTFSLLDGLMVRGKMMPRLVDMDQQTELFDRLIECYADGIRQKKR